MKSLKIKLYDKLNIDLLYKAFIRSSKGKKYKKEVLLFELNLEENLYKIIDEIKNNYVLGKYKIFTIYEPKKRVIRYLSFKDRIVQNWYIEEFIKPYYQKRFIYDTYACINNKGVHKCITRLKSLIKEDDYVIKFDIHKFFDSIDVNILKTILFEKIKDEKLKEFTNLLIGDSIPIGNYTSQWFGNIYLSQLDYYVKQLLKKRYVRYLDDFCILVDSKEEAKEIYNKIEIFVDKLNLKLNPKSRYFPIKNGIDFCGYILYKNYILVRKKNIKKFIKKIKNNTYNLSSFKGYLKYSSSDYIYKYLGELIDKQIFDMIQ